MKILRFVLLALLLSSCGTVINYDYEKSTDFTQYKTYNYFDDMKTGLSELDTKRLIRAIDARLETKSMLRSDNPDFFIDIMSQDIQNRNNSNVGVGVGGTGRNMGGAVSIGLPLGGNQSSRELIIEFVDKRNGERLFWQAVSQSPYRSNGNPEQRQAQFDELVEKIFKAYPPKIKD